ncbi:uncharacterized protein LOC135961195 [Calliphora vicina]|uniref:uncharacterized protein LOC135952577 n=1 Tax=Calliphora vicina TaxID=7373 RepID=UPI00325A9086
MDSKEDIQPKTKRVRTNPTRKWSLVEEKALIEFLMGHRDFEKPTAQAYYRQFSTEMQVDIEWKLARAKVRNMRTSFNKAKSWEGSTGAGSMEGETMRATLVKMCTFFYELDDIFGSRIVEAAIIEDTVEPDPIEEMFEVIEVDAEENSTSQPNVQLPSPASTSRKGIYSRTALSEILQMQSEMFNYKKEKGGQELKFKEKELALKEREIDLREKELTSNERLKIMELEMKERIAMEELKHKYK